MNDKNYKTVKAAIKHFEAAANHGGDPATSNNIMASGLVCLTGLIADLIDEVEALRVEVKVLREQN